MSHALHSVRSSGRGRGEDTYGIRCVGRLDSLSLEEEANRVWRLALALAEREHELLELGAPLDLEEDLVVVICHLDVEVLYRGRASAFLTRGAVLGSIGHGAYQRGP